MTKPLHNAPNFREPFTEEDLLWQRCGNDDSLFKMLSKLDRELMSREKPTAAGIEQGIADNRVEFLRSEIEGHVPRSSISGELMQVT